MGFVVDVVAIVGRVIPSLLYSHRIVLAPPRALWLVAGASLGVRLTIVCNIRLIHVGVRLDMYSFDAHSHHILPEIILDIPGHCGHLRLLSLVCLLGYLGESVLVTAERVIDESLLVIVIL